MVIDFEKIAEAHLEGFKGGQGKLDTRNYVYVRRISMK